MSFPAWLTPTVVLLGVFALAMLGLLLVLWFKQRMEEVDNCLSYHTCDWSAIESDTRKLQAMVPDAPRKQTIYFASGSRDYIPDRHRGRRFWVIGQQLQIGKTAVGVIAAARNAAYRDNQSGSRSINPEPKGSRFHVLWLTTYESERMTPELAPIIRAQNEA